MKTVRRRVLVAALVIALAACGAVPAAAQQPPIKIGLVQGLTGPFEVYAKQVVTGFKLGLEYATAGKLEVGGRKLEVLVEDDQLKPDVAKRLVTKLYSDDKVDLVVGTTSSAAALAVLPVAQEFKKVLIVEPAVADSITGEHWNRYIFRTGRNSGQDAIANALAVAKPGVAVATIAQDYAFGRDGVAAYRAAVEKLGAKVVHEEYTPRDATDFTAPIQKIIAALKDRAKREGVPVTAETCPHYLTLTAEDVPAGATAYKCCPPIRDAANRDALWLGLEEGTLDVAFHREVLEGQLPG